MRDSFLEPVVEVETVVGPLLLPRADKIITSTILRWKVWEAMETDYLRRTLRPGDTFVDVGANVGYFSVLAAKLVGPTGTVIAVEPEARSLDLLHRNLARNGCHTAHVIEAAAGATAGQVALALDEMNRGAHRIVDSGDLDAEVAVPCVVLDEVLPRKVDFVKVDAQGYDHEIVAGLARTIAANQQLRLLVELSRHELARRKVDPEGVLAGYRARDFVFRMFDANGWPGEASEAEVLSLFYDPSQHEELSLILDRPATPPFSLRSQPLRVSALDVRPIKSGAIVFQQAPARMHTLNESAAVVLDLCSGEHSVAAIIERVQEIYRLSAPPTIEIEACLDQLRRKDLLTDAAS